MKKYLILLLIISMCGGTAESDSDPFAEEMLVAKDVINEKQNENQEEFKKSQENNTQSTPPPPSVSFDIIEIYNTKLISELCEDATQIETTSQECLLKYRDNLEIVFSYAEELKKYTDSLNQYFSEYPSAFTEEYADFFEFLNSKYFEVPKTYGEVADMYSERFGSNQYLQSADSPFIDEEVLTVFATEDLTQKTVDTTIQYTNEAYSLWMGKDYYGKSQAKAIYLMITGADLEAGEKTNSEYCKHLEQKEYPSAEWCNLDTYENYVLNGGAGINSSGPVEGYYFMVMAPRGNNLDQGYKTMTYHEVFHIYQMSNIFSRDYEEADRKFGRRTGDDPNSDVAWWGEGNADFFAALYTKDLNGFKEEMKWALEGNGPFSMPRKTQFFENGQKLYNISWSQGDTVDLAYRIGSWFTAYLVHQNGEQSVYDFWETVDKGNFSNTFINIFGKDYKNYIDEFENWLQLPNAELYKILEPIYKSKIK